VPPPRESRGKPRVGEPRPNQDELRRKAEDLVAVFESLADGLLIVDDSLIVVEVNRPMLSLLGHSDRSDVLGSDASELRNHLMRANGTPISPDDIGLERAVRRGDVVRGGCIAAGSDQDGARWLDTVASPIRDGGGQLLGAALVARDLTDQRLREHELALQARASDIVLAATELDAALGGLASLAVEMVGTCCAIYLLDQTSEILDLAALRARDRRAISDLTSQLAQRPPRVGEGVAGSAVRANEAVVLPDLTDEGVRRRTTSPSEAQLVRRFGLRSVISVPLRGSEGPLGAITVGWSPGGRPLERENVRFVEELARRAAWALEQHRFVQSLEDALERLELVLNSLAAGLIIIGSDGRAILVNAAARRMIGLPGTGVGMALQEILLRAADDVEDPRDLDEAVAQASERAITSQGSFRLRQPLAIDVDWMATPVRDEQGQVLGQVVIWVDVTHIRAVERVKDELAADLSEALRAPLHSISTYAVQSLRRARRAGGDQFVSHGLEVILRNARQVSMHVNDLVDAARFDPSALRLDLSEVDVRDVVQQAVDESKAITTVHRFRIDVPAAMPNPTWDPVRARQALLHVLSNAVKYWPDGGQIAVRVRPQLEGVVISVRDRGLGIPPDEHERIFDRFYRIASQPAHRRIRGNGLGLFLVQSIVEAHGGTAWIESAGIPGEGTTVFLLLPWSPTTPVR